jgi:16S rRNA (cytosine967-C5)-methyltransferase
MTRVRLAAARVLQAVEARRTTLAGALDRAHSSDPSRRDAALLVELAAGALRWQNELDALIAAASRRPVADLDAAVRAVLRVGAYQIRHLDRVPAHAVVHEAVESVRALGRPRAAGLVNAVLRALVRGEGASRLPARPADGASREAQMAYLTTTLSHPAWLAERWLMREGFDVAARWCAFNNAPPTLTIRARPGRSIDEIEARLRAEGLASERSPYVPGALRLPPGTFGRIPAELRAEVRVQDEGSQLVGRLAGARPGERVIDLCAAPGGKTMMLAEAMGFTGLPSRSLLVACDYRPGRVSLLARTLGAAGLAVPLVALDAAQPLPFAAVFDRVLLDAPCSGLGTLRRDPDLKWARRFEDLPALAAAERRMLAQAASIVRPGGRVVYATCSSEADENMDVVRAFLAETPRFRLEPLADAAAGFVTPEGCLMTNPARHGLDAFFAAVLVRQEAA